ncbi:hypothetical protein [Robertkochia solimangrovi]|uniref:hypothetical protein n=1 Tax=Robertkochia solimangrovi TaxID=2213046 RepID=UPI00117DE98A|nr:hypothetical protein [Robertkochia solimangrovi]TRZ44373.1 hypothetical protein DMZ48_07650 [Robertkochia solimangrovi]
MEQHNSDKKIREVLESRKVSPSSESWGKLSEMLDTAEESPKKKTFPWIRIAAAVIVLLGAGTLWMINSGGEAVVVPVVHQEAKPESVVPELTTPVKKLTEVPVPESSVAATPAGKAVEPLKRVVERKSVIAEGNPEIFETQEAIAETRIQETFTAEELAIASAAESIRQKQMEGEVTDAEIDALLLEAQRKLYGDTIIKNNKVDAMALLDEVEFELDRSFKDKVFEALRKGYQKVKTAVANHDQ